MTRLTRVLRALMLALVLPALLIPSGWSARVCLCELLHASSADTCCETADAAPETRPVASCCSSEADASESAPNAGRVDRESQSKVAFEPQSKSKCEGCCRVVDAGQIDLMASCYAPISAPAPILFSTSPLEIVAAPMLRHRAVRAARPSLAPPRVSAALPLRI